VTIDGAYEYARSNQSDIQGHIEFMHGLVVDLDAKQVVELGVRYGMSTAAFLHAVEMSGGHLWSCDIGRPGGLVAEFVDCERWSFNQGDDLALAAEAPECDVLFIDTSHYYEHTLAELRAYGPKARRVILLHDTELRNPDGDTSGIDYPVQRAIDEFVAGGGWREERRSGHYGLGVLWRVDGD
jgi:cephalosporin hydroxylase